jgi:pimeloyl-ACP methyl ester carboxylesterase
MAAKLERYRAAERRLWDKLGTEPVERFVTLPSGGRVRVQELGDGPPVLFVHGVSVAGTSWCTLAAAMDGCRRILLDRPGCGLSDPIVGGPLRTVDQVAAFADRLVPDVLDALELDTAAVLSTSYGGWFALRGAAAAPDRIERIVEYSCLIGAPAGRAPMTVRMAAIPGMSSMMSHLPVTRSMVKSMLRQIGMRRAVDSGTFDADMVDWFVSLLRDTDTFANDQRSAPDVVTPIRGHNRRVWFTDDLLAKVTMPVLFLWGDEDTNGGADVARQLAPRLPDARLEIIPEAGHAPWLDELELCTRRTMEFLTV